MISLQEFESIYGFDIYTGVENAQKIIDFATDENGCIDETRGVACIALVDMACICSAFHLKLAVMKAALNQRNGNMKTRSLSSEILYLVSGTKNITEALKNFKVKSDSETIAVVFSADGSKDSMQPLLDCVGGRLLNEEEFDSSLSETRRSEIAKLFKISAQELQSSSLEDAVVMKLATKDVM